MATITTLKTKTTHPGITILTPLYNGIEFLEESLASVVAQTYDKWELIIGINGHGIGSEVENKAMEIINNYDRFRHKIRVIGYNNTKGKPETMNHMVVDATYEYIAILDVDDIWMPEKLERQVPFLEDYDVVGTRCEYFGMMTGYPNVPVGDLSNINFLMCNPIINCSAIIRKCDAYWDDSDYQHKIKGLDDYDMWLRLKHKNKRFYNIKKILCKHRIHGDSAFNTSNANYIDELKAKWKTIYEKSN